MDIALGIVFGGGVIASLLAGAFGVYQLWLVERQKFKWDQHIRKAEIYEAVSRAMNGFYEEVGSKEKRAAALEEFRVCELVCPDHIVRAATGFLKTVAVGSGASEEDQQRALGELRLKMRRDLHPDTELSVEDFRIWGAN